MDPLKAGPFFHRPPSRTNPPSPYLTCTLVVCYSKTSTFLNPFRNFISMLTILKIIEIKKKSRTNGLVLSFFFYPVLYLGASLISLTLRTSTKNLELSEALALREKCPHSELFLSVFGPNAGKYRLE